MPSYTNTTFSRTANQSGNKHLRRRYVLGVIGGTPVWGQVSKQLTGTLLAIRLWNWNTGKPRDLRVINLADEQTAENFAFFDTREGLNRAKSAGQTPASRLGSRR